ncbi:MAG TPA: SCO family protein [Acidimicrobiales bacterium]|nr:SCO family protein [Acidimicrobiales bacterium]
MRKTMQMHGPDLNAPAVVAAFHTALRHQVLVVLLLLAAVPVAWNVWRWRSGAGQPAAPLEGWGEEPVARRALRVAFGLLWVADGLLQLQQSMPLGLVPRVVEPAAAGSPGWVQTFVADASAPWSRHPVAAAAAVVWVQLGLGAWMLAANRGLASRLSGVATAGWAAVVWAAGNAFGGIFGGGVSWLTGAPGAVVLYGVAGVLVALPEARWTGPRLGRLLLRASGVVLLGAALLQAWPGRGFWQGGPDGGLSSAVAGMASTPQPGWLHAAVAGFGDLAAAHGWAVNLGVVVALAGAGALLVAGSLPAAGAPAGWGRRLALAGRVGMVAALAFCAADWVLVQDLGVLGGLGTDPNSMVPAAALVAVAWLALTRAPAGLPAGVTALPRAARRWWQVPPAAALRVTASAAALGVMLLGVVPLGAAALEPHADPIITTALDGAPQPIDVPAGGFTLTDEHGRPVSLASLRGRTVALTFLDPVCTSDCPIIAREFAQTAQLLGRPRAAAFVAVDINPRFLDPAYLRAFDHEQHLGAVPGWRYLTGSLGALRAVWKEYGAYVAETPSGGMVDHNDLAYVIGPDGRLRDELDADPGPGTSASESSFAVTLAGVMRQVIGAGGASA